MDENDKKNNYVRYMSNPRCYTIKRWLMEILKEEYTPHDMIVERVATSLTTDKDVEEFGKLIMQVYHKAYNRAVSDYREQAEKMGLKIVVSTKEDV